MHSKLLIILLLTGSYPVLSDASTKKPLDNPVSLESFNKIWVNKCKDIGERSIDANINVTGQPQKLLHGHAFIVSDHFIDRSYKCYRTAFLHRVIISGSITKPQLTFVTGSIFDQGMYALYDYISSDLSIDVELYETTYGSEKSYHIVYTKNKKKYAIEATPESVYSKLPSTSGYHIRILMVLEPIASNTFQRNVISDEAVGKLSNYPNGCKYIFSGDKVVIHYPMVGSKVGINIGNFVERKLKFTAISDSTKDNLIKLVDNLGKSFNSFNGSIEGDFYGPDLDVKWLKSWINGKGHLTQENKKKIILSNKKRLYIWLTRYIKKKPLCF